MFLVAPGANSFLSRCRNQRRRDGLLEAIGSLVESVRQVSAMLAHERVVE
jgi:hypothetical protein